MAEPLVAVGIPVYNGEKWLRFTVTSILQQSFRDLAVIIVDNASSDRTGELCAEIAASDSRVRYYRNEQNIGVFANYDAAFRYSASRFFKWCPVGDRCAPDFIERAVEVLDESEDVILVHAKTGLIGNVGSDPGRFTVELNLTSGDPGERFRYYLNKVRLNNVMNGLIRSDELSNTCMNLPFHASDKCMVAELALRGKFIELPDELLFRRMDVETATALQSEEERSKFFSVEPRSPSVLWRWKVEKTLLSGVLGSPITTWKKLKLLPYLLKRIFWQRKVLTEELVRHFHPRK